MAASEESRLLPDSKSYHEEHEVAIHNRRSVSKRLITIEPALLIYALYRAAILPLQQQYLYMRVSQNFNSTIAENHTDFDCHANKSDSQYMTEQNIQSETSLWMIYLSICTLVPAFFSTIFIGGYSDRGGRKIALVCPVIGGILKLYICLVLIIYDLPIYVLLIAAAVEGMSGGIAVFLMGAFSYISDVTTPEQRSLRIIILEVCLGLSSTISYIGSGYLINGLGYLGTTISLHMILVFTLFVTFFLPETLATDDSVKFFTFKHFLRTFNVYFVNDGTGRRMCLLSTVIFLILFCPAALGCNDVEILFMLASPLCWNSVMIGYFKGLYYLVLSIGAILLTKLAQPRCGDLPLVMIGCASAVFHCVYWAYAHTSLMMFIGNNINHFNFIFKQVFRE